MKPKREPRVRCTMCRGIEWRRITVEFFSTCAYLIQTCLGCGITIAVKIPKPASVSRG